MPIDIDPKEYVQTLDFLKKIDFLADLPEEALKSMLFSLQKQNFPKNKSIIFQGEIANSLFLIKKGSVSITTKNKGNKLVLAELSAPSYFGEISLIRPLSATANVNAGEEGVEVLVLTHDSFKQLSKKFPDIQAHIKRIIDSRLAAKDQAKKTDDNGEN